MSGIPKNGDPKTVTFPMREIDSVRFQVKGGSGPNVGLLELEVYAVPSVPEAPHRIDVHDGTVTWTPPDFDGGAPITGYVVRVYRDGALVHEETTGADQRDSRFPLRPAT